MSGGKSTPRSVTTYIEVFEEAILGSQMRGLVGDWNKLRRKVEALSQRVRNREADGARAPDWAYRLEQKLLIEVMRECLLPAVIDDLVENLRSTGEREGADLGAWAPLDREVMERHRRRELSADAAVLAALKHYAKKPSYIRILEGLRALEDLHEVREHLDAQFDATSLVNEGKRLAAVVGTLLPPTARRLLSFEIEVRFRSEVEGKPIQELEPVDAFWHHHLADLGVWHPVWSELRSQDDQPDPLGTLFVADAQAVYEDWHAEVEAARAKKTQEEKRKRRAAAAKQQRLRQKEADQRAEQIRLREEEEICRQEQERERKAEAAEVQRRIKAQREEQEREQREEQERVQRDNLERLQEGKRAARRERKRQSRQSKPSLEPHWDERALNYGQSEWERWCKSRGMSPKEFTDEFREKFIRRIL